MVQKPKFLWWKSDSRCSRLLAAKLTPYRSEQRQLVLREYQVLRRLSHQHLVQLHAAILTPSCLVLIEELCSGRELLYNLNFLHPNIPFRQLPLTASTVNPVGCGGSFLVVCLHYPGFRGS
uniref:Protein kinase domain-containing protein n=1 Tax=Astyanax mexicanus TaxID=7994 RepID=A0A8B9HZV7_ASTMX